MRDISVYKRGQVWFINDDVVNKGSIQSKSRPYLVVSNDICNANSPVIHMAPITSKSKKPQSTHVEYNDESNKTSIILLEQITPKSVPHISKFSRYMYSLSSAIMEKVDDAILVQFSLLHHKPCDSPERLYFHTEEYQNTLGDLANSIVEDIEEDTHIGESQIDKFNKKIVKYKEMNGIHDIVPIERTESGRIRWNRDLKKQILRDSEEMKLGDILRKYDMKLTTYRTTISKIRGELSRES